jgi:DNA-binding NarL/FixJ family response regulator
MMKLTVITNDDRFFEHLNSAFRHSSLTKFDPNKADSGMENTDLLIIDLFCFTNKQIPAGKYPIAVLSGVPSYAEAMKFLHRGVKGYGNRFMTPENLILLVNTVVSGQIWLPPSFLNRLIASIPQSGTSKLSAGFFEDLSGRENEVAELVGKGMSNKEIADVLDISVRTVKAHLSSIFVKTGCRDRLEVALKLKHG